MGTLAPAIQTRPGARGPVVCGDPATDDAAAPSAIPTARRGSIAPTPSSRAVAGSHLARLSHRPWPSVLVGIAFVLICALAGAAPVDAGDETCHPIEVTWYSPSGVAGCTLDGPTAGVASWYPGRVAAANWCVWPWTACGSARVTSHATGISITVPVAQYCDCWWTTDRRLVDLTQDQVLALGLDPADGIFAVTVEPIEQAGDPRLDESVAGDGASGAAIPPVTLPDTALRP